MTTATQITLSQKNTRLIVLLAMLLLSSVGMFGQEVATVSTSAITTEVAADETTAATVNAVESNSNINIVSWFMGTKQSPNANSAEGAVNSKKQMINSGIAPNRLLIKTFLKKASSFQTAVA